MREEMQPCPFCGPGTHMQAYQHATDGTDCFVQCNTCFTTGPTGKSKDLAIAAWNTRAPNGCDYPLCKSETEQQSIAAQVHAELYGEETKHYAELLAAIGKLIKAKGRFHTEQNYAALVVAYDAVTTKEPNAKP